MELLFQPETWIALTTLTALEIVLGIDNIIFISILVSRLPAGQRSKGRILGLGLAMVTRILLLLSIAWVMGLKTGLFTVLNHEISGRDLILLCGGLFLLAKSTHEIHHSLEDNGHEEKKSTTANLAAVLLQIAIIDIVFSLDSVITAVGLAKDVAVMIAAIIISIGVMMAAAGSINDFVDRHPTIKMLALSFLILVGATLVAEGAGFEFPRGYIYFAMAFSTCVEMLNIRLRKNGSRPVHLHKDLDMESSGNNQ
ncbi:MAG: TerC family protein [Prosthecochloris sp.]|uniref:Integral membrane protein TerC n=1 Tax=Prosthecochloris aestuarii (strain DSM 271 / SK 413) TaxID=290512 RepID=B4S4N5_PROA2|nr:MULTISPECIES: TerC family protein [Prosthecochloris]ACF46931.1 Integral membrane protein TerC [Prosthecochloris aestuarii DSM 271]MCW8798614.1 TerC family protein [Prosthecochloris sp.]